MKRMKLLKQQTFQFLSQHHVMVVSTVSAKGVPESAVMYYKMDPANWNFYFMTGTETQKFKNIQENNRVSFVVGMGPQIFTVQGRGQASVFLRDGAEFMEELAKQFELELSPYWPVTELKHQSVALIQVTPDWLRVLNLEPSPFPETVWDGYYQLIGTED